MDIIASAPLSEVNIIFYSYRTWYLVRISSNKLLQQLLSCPAITLIALFPNVLGVPELLLHLLDLGVVTSVLAHIVAELDCRPAVRGGNLNDNVERLGLLAR